MSVTRPFCRSGAATRADPPPQALWVFAEATERPAHGLRPRGAGCEIVQTRHRQLADDALFLSAGPAPPFPVGDFNIRVAAIAYAAVRFLD
jgi:hypothetical protein